MRPILGLSMLVALAACKPSNTERPRRVLLHRTGGTTFELKPEEGQHPYCLAYTVSKRGLTRQLTMSKNNESFECPAGRAIGLRSFKVPLGEGPVKVYVLFTSQKVNAGSVAQQLLDITDRQQINVMDLRLPGVANLDSVDFVPEEDVAPTVGGELGVDAGAAPDAGAAEDAGAAATDGGAR
jgi:hypothetical protein